MVLRDYKLKFQKSHALGDNVLVKDVTQGIGF